MNRLPERFTGTCLIVFFALTTLARAEMREWTSAADPNRKIRGELVGLEGEMVVLRLANGKAFKFELSKLSEGDREFIRTGKEPAPPPREKPFDLGESTPAVILDFVFDENPDQVFVRLKNHRGVRGNMNEIMRGRTGLNDMFHIELGGVRYGIYFDWTSATGGLSEVSLQSSGFPPSEYEESLKQTWETVRRWLEGQYGEPAMKGGYPAKETVKTGLSMSSDIWKTPKGELYFGIGLNDDGKYSCVLRTRQTPFLAPE